MKRKRRRLKKTPKIVLRITGIMLLLYFMSLLFSNNSSYANPEYLLDYTDFITSGSENNKTDVKYISDGMTIDNFKNVFNREEKYVNKSGSYKQIKYNFEKHYKYSELEGIYKNLNNSDIVKLEIIGSSYDGRNIYSIEIGKGNDISMFEGNIHSAEIAPVLFLTKYAVELVNEYEKGNSEIIDMLNNEKIIIVPSVNPDGYDYAINGKSALNSKSSYVYNNYDKIGRDYYKANINGVDLNRNFPTQTGGLYYITNDLSYTISLNKSTDRLSYFPGDNLGSELETQAIMYWIYKHYEKAHVYAAVHSAGQVIYQGKPNLSDRYNYLCARMSTIVSDITGYIVLSTDYEELGYGNDGTSTDFISQLAHNFKFSTDTGRLLNGDFKDQIDDIKVEMCAMTIETLTEYTLDLETIKSEYYDKDLKKAFNELVTY